MDLKDVLKERMKLKMDILKDINLHKIIIINMLINHLVMLMQSQEQQKRLL